MVIGSVSYQRIKRVIEIRSVVLSWCVRNRFCVLNRPDVLY